jgi:putative hydrolase of the HAD superfamily
MLPFDVILFDVGGVLLTNGWDHGERAAAAAQFHLDLPDFEARHAANYATWERGEVPMQTYLDAVVFHQPRTFSTDDFFAFMLSQSKELPDGALGVLEELADNGSYLVGALNNEARETNEYRFEKFALREMFEVSLSSCYLGLRKPDVAIYNRAVDILGGPADRILFIDDRPENIEGALAAGMKGLRFQGAATLRKDLETLGVL